MKKFTKAGFFAFGILLSVTFNTLPVSAANYTVQKDDSLYKIGRLFDMSVKNI